MVFKANFNNISATSWRLALFVEETRLPGETTDLPQCHWQILSHNVVSSTSRLSGIRTYNVSVDKRWLHR